MVKRILRSENDYLIYGYADFAPSVKGLPPGIGGALTKMANWYMPGHALPSTEWRSSKCAPDTHEYASALAMRALLARQRNASSLTDCRTTG